MKADSVIAPMLASTVVLKFVCDVSGTPKTRSRLRP